MLHLFKYIEDRFQFTKLDIYIAVMHYGVWLLIFLKGADENEIGIS